MTRVPGFDPIVRWWQAARPGARLAVGAILVILIGLGGLTPTVISGNTLAWPYAALVAAIGWGRSGFAFSPLLLLIAFGVVQDITTSAPLGCFALINLLVYGASAFLFQTVDSERTPGLAIALPLVLLFFAMLLVWSIASLVTGHMIRVEPLLAVFLTTALVQIVLGPCFDLGIRPGVDSGANL